MGGIAARGRRPAAWALVGALTTLPAVGLLVATTPSAYAAVTPLPGIMSTAAQNTSTFAVHVPVGVDVRAVNGVVTMPEVVEGGTVTIRVNGAVRTSVPSALYQKVRIPVEQSDVIADGTIGLTMTTEGPAQAGAACLPTAGVASMRKIELDYRGAEVAPTTVADFFPPSSSGLTVVIPEDADSQMITAGLTAVAALAYRYDDDTPIDLSLTVPPAEAAVATQRVVALVDGRPGAVTTAVSTASGIPLLTLTGNGDALVDAARALSVDTLGLSGTDAENPSQQAKPRSTAKTRTLGDLGIDTVALSGYGSVTQQLELRQDSFGVPVSTMEIHLKGSHTAFADSSGARLDVRANGDLVGSTVLGQEATFDLPVKIPASKLRSVNELELTLNAVAPDGSACTPPSIPAAEVDLDTGGSTVTVTHGTGQAKGFQLFPQIFEGTLPVALRTSEGRQASAAINAAALVSELQRAAGSPLEIQLMQPDAFLADDRSGLMVGALNADSDALDAPLNLSSTRLLDRDDSTFEVTSQEPYAALESIDRNDRLVLMLGSWAPDNKAAPGELARKVVDAVVNTGWADLDGDLVIADAANPAFVASSRSLAPHQETKEEKSYAKWFVLVIGVLLLLLAMQVVIAIRRDRKLSRERDDEFEDDGPAYVEDDEDEPDFEVDALGDVDDLEVHDYLVEQEPPHDDADAEELGDEELGDEELGDEELDDDELDYELDADELDDEDEPAGDDDEPDAEPARQDQPASFIDDDDTGEIPVIDADEYEEYADDEQDADQDVVAIEAPDGEAGPDEPESESDEPDPEGEWDDWDDWGEESDELEPQRSGPPESDEALDADAEAQVDDESYEAEAQAEPDPEPDLEPDDGPDAGADAGAPAPRRRWSDPATPTSSGPDPETGAAAPIEPPDPPAPTKPSGKVGRRGRRRR